VITFTPSTFRDCQKMAPSMRHIDLKEVKASSGLDPYQALITSINLDGVSDTIRVNDEIVAMCGVVDGGNIGVPWMLGTCNLRRNAKSLLPLSKKWLKEHGDKYDLLFNYVSSDNLSSIRWLKYLGFSLIRYIPHHGVGRSPFYEFVRIKQNV